MPEIDIALIQNESEMLNVPARDLSGFLRAGETTQRWNWSLFTEHSFDEALARADRFDCLILGYNAIHRSPALCGALEEALPNTGVLLLHQMGAHAFDCLRDDLALRTHRLRHARSELTVPDGVDGGLDVVLNWPNPLGTAQEANNGDWQLNSPPDPWQAVNGLDAPSDGAWRVVLEVDSGDRHVPVLVRTNAWRQPLLAACTLLLEPDRLEHARLLTNLISFCARGLPEIVAFTEADDLAWTLLVDKLELAGAHTVQIFNREPSYGCWPEIGAGTMVVPRGYVSPEAQSWEDRGGRVVTMEEGRLLAREGGSDLRWLARKWASELAVRPTADWLGGWSEGAPRPGSILATRAVLRTVALLRDPAYDAATAGDPGGLGVPDLREPALARRVRNLLQRRRIGLGHVDHTVSTTAAALDLDQLVPGGVLRDGVRTRAEQWLRSQYDHAAIEDKFDIARCLSDRRLLDRAFGQLRGKPASPVLQSKVWDAARSCGSPVPSDISMPRAGTDEIRESVLVAGAFLTGLARCRGHRLERGPVDRSHETVGAALATLRRKGSLLGRTRIARGNVDVEEISTEALALLTLFRHPDWLLEPNMHTRGPDAQTVRSREPLAPVLTEGLLAETARLRVRNADLEQSDRRLRIARNYCAVVALLATAIAVAAVRPAPKTVSDWLTLATLVILILLTLFAVLGRWELLPTWAQAIMRMVTDGVSGIPKRLSEIAQRRASP